MDKAAGQRKHKKWILMAVLFILLAGFCLFSLQRGEAESSPPVLRVSVILPHEDDGYWGFIREGMQGVEEEYEKHYRMDVKYLYPQLNYNIPQMTELINQESAAKVDVLVVQGNENQEYVKALRDAQTLGTQIICMDTDISDFPEHLYIGTDNYNAGKQLGEAVAKTVKDTARIAVISGEEEYLNLQERLQGFQDALSKADHLTLLPIAYDHYDGLTALRLFHELSEEADVAVFLEGVPGTTLQSVYSGKLSEYRYVFGFDAYNGVKSGLFDGVMLQDTRGIGEMILQKIGEEIDTKEEITGSFYTDAIFLTLENYDEVMG